MNSSPGLVTKAPNRQHLDRHLVSGLAWTAIAKWSGQVASWLSLILLAKLLSPFDFGLISMTVVLLGLITVLSECGISGAIVMTPELTPLKIRQMHTIAVILGFVALGLSALAAPSMAVFFHTPQLRLVVPCMGLAFVMTGLRMVPYSLLVRDLRFRVVAGIDAGQTIIQSLTAVLLAWLNFHYWALVLSVLAGFAFSCVAFFLLRPCGLTRPDFTPVRDELKFSWRLMLVQLSWFGYSNADFVVAGRMLGTDAVGLYTMAWNLASVPVEKVAALVSRVSPSVIAQVQNDPVELRRYIRGITETLAMVTFPISIGMGLIAGPLMEAVFLPHWWPAAPALRLLAFCAVFRSIIVISQPILSVTGELEFSLKISLLITVLLPLAFIFGSRWGGTGIAAAWLCVFPVLSLPLFARTLTRTALPASQFLASLRPAAIASAVMIAGVLLTSVFAVNLSSGKLLAAEILAGAVSYLGTLALFFRPRLTAVLQTVMRRPAETTA